MPGAGLIDLTVNKIEMAFGPWEILEQGIGDHELDLEVKEGFLEKTTFKAEA